MSKDNRRFDDRRIRVFGGLRPLEMIMPANAIRLSEGIARYLAMRQRGARSTYDQDRVILGRLVKGLGDIQLRHLTPEHVERYLFGGVDHRTGAFAEGITASLSPVTINFYRARLSAFCQYMRRLGWLRSDPMINIQRHKVIPRRKTWLSPQQMLAMIAAAPAERDRGLIAVGAYLGLRASEITALQVSDVNLSKGYLDVVITKTSERDAMPIPCGLDEVLRGWLTAYAAEVGVLQPSYYLFPGRRGPRFAWVTQEDGSRTRTLTDPVLRPSTRWRHPERVVQATARLIGLESVAGQGVHLLRRSAGRAFYDVVRAEGHDSALREVSAYLHHARSSTTELYLGLDPERSARDTRLRGKQFLELGGMGNVVRLPVRDGKG